MLHAAFYEKTKSNKSLFLVKNSVFVQTIEFLFYFILLFFIYLFIYFYFFCFKGLLSVSRVRMWYEFRFGSPEVKMWTFCCIPKVGVFKNMYFCTFLRNLFKTNYCSVVHEVQPFKMVLSFKNLFEKDLY